MRDEAASRFRALHAEFLVLPNPWDAGTARLLADLGFAAIASSSAAQAWAEGKPDGAIGRKSAIAHAAMLSAASGLPVNGDFEAGFGITPAEVADTIEAALEAGVAGCSIEDTAHDRPEPIFDEIMSCRRLEAARDAVERAGSDFVLTGRCEILAFDVPDRLAIACRRLKAYEAAGAHVVYAPGLTRAEDIERVLVEVSVPLSVIAGVGGVSDDLAALKALGVSRVTLGSNLYKVALGAFVTAAEGLREAERADLPGKLTSAFFDDRFERKR
nr:isocitrate lyase/phosphoenolpyruvate mutase family protein [Acuticoccus mangrovi]